MLQDHYDLTLLHNIILLCVGNHPLLWIAKHIWLSLPSARQAPPAARPGTTSRPGVCAWHRPGFVASGNGLAADTFQKHNLYMQHLYYKLHRRRMYFTNTLP